MQRAENVHTYMHTHRHTHMHTHTCTHTVEGLSRILEPLSLTEIAMSVILKLLTGSR